MKIEVRTTTCAAATWLLLVACVSPQTPSIPSAASVVSQQPTAPKRLVVAIQGDINLFYSKANPNSGAIAGLDAVEDLVLAGMSIVDNQGTLQPQLAEAVPSVDNGLWRVLPDGRMETSWTIRPNVSWHDGVPLGASDLAFTGSIIRDPELPTFRDRNSAFLDAVEVIDSRTVVAKWNRPFIGADALFTRAFAAPLPRHLLERTYGEDKANFTNGRYWSEEFVGLGPYRVREFERGVRIILDANDGYALGRPKIDVVEVRLIPSMSTLSANILSGSVEVTMGRTLSLDEGLQVRDLWADGKMDLSPANFNRIFPQLLNPSPSVIGNVQFRRAVLHAIDRQQMVDTLQHGMTPVAHSPLLPDQPKYREVEAGIVRYEYDPRRAVQMIEELGYTRGPNGMFRDGDGQSLTVEILADGGQDIIEKATMTVADYWQRSGIAAQPSFIPQQRYLDREYRNARPGFLLSGGSNDLDALYALHSANTPVPESNFVGNNGSRYMNPEYDALVDRFLATIPMQPRMQALAQAVRHVAEEIPIFGLYYRVQPTMITNRVVGVTARQLMSSEAWNARDWDLRQ